MIVDSCGYQTKLNNDLNKWNDLYAWQLITSWKHPAWRSNSYFLY